MSSLILLPFCIRYLNSIVHLTGGRLKGWQKGKQKREREGIGDFVGAFRGLATKMDNFLMDMKKY